jgi:hypothetical protein
MHVPIRSWIVLACAAAMLVVASTAAAQIEDQVSEYGALNGEGYLQPLADAIGADLNAGLWRSAYVPSEGFYIALEVQMMATFFDDAQRTFDYTPGPDDNTPVDGADVSVPTVVGDLEGGTIPTDMPPEIAYVPGFDINSFGLAAPQLRIGSFKGTEAVVRFFTSDVSDVELGNISLIGVGGRHSISQYMGPDFPVDLSAGFFWQSLQLGDELVDGQAMTYGIQVGKRFPSGFAILEPYAAISYDSFEMDVTYDVDEDDPETETIDIAMETEAGMKFTLGLKAQMGFMDLNGEYSFGDQSGFAVGLGFAFRHLPAN